MNLKINRQPPTIFFSYSPNSDTIYNKDNTYYTLGTIWINNKDNEVYILANIDSNKATWILIGK